MYMAASFLTSNRAMLILFRTANSVHISYNACPGFRVYERHRNGQDGDPHLSETTLGDLISYDSHELRSTGLVNLALVRNLQGLDLYYDLRYGLFLSTDMATPLSTLTLKTLTVKVRFPDQ